MRTSTEMRELRATMSKEFVEQMASEDDFDQRIRRIVSMSLEYGFNVAWEAMKGCNVHVEEKP